MEKKQNIIHIGLGKTGTTSLQKNVFNRIKFFTYNHPVLSNLLQKSAFYVLNSDDKETIRSILSTGSHFISNEDLIGWNPRFWEMNADKNLELFGKKTKIIITVRTTRDYLRSVYLQQLHDANIKKPENFLIDSKTYEILGKYSSEHPLFFFDVDSFDLQNLYKIYSSRFDDVNMISMDSFTNLDFLEGEYGNCNDELDQLRTLSTNLTFSNRSFSRLAVKIVFFKEKFLNIFGLKTNGFNFKDPLKYLEYLNEDRLKIKFVNLSLSEKLLNFFPRLRVRLGKYFTLRYFLQNILDKVYYSKYELPEKVYRNVELEIRNDEFLNSFKK